MAQAIDIMHDVKGLAEVEQGLREIGRDVGRKGLIRSTSAGARVIRDKARSLAPKKTGKLRKNIVVQKFRKTKNKNQESRHIVTIRKKGKASDPQNAYYGFFVEYGTSKQAPQPFMRPAYESKREAAADAVIDSLEKTIDTEKSKQGFK